MTKRARAKIKAQEQKRKRQSRSRRRSVAVIVLILSLGLSGLILAQWRVIRIPFSSSMPMTTPTPSLSASNPSKEYIYAGGKLVATEEPNASPSPTPTIVPAPSNLTATAQFSGQTLTGVQLQWSNPSGTVDHFRIERTQDKNTPFAPLPDTAGSSATTFTDINASQNIAYLYRICAVDAQGNLSTYTNVDLSTTVWFVDEPLVSYSEDHANATLIKAAHFTQLRAAINAVRHLVDPNATDFQWTTTNNTPAPQVGGLIYASYLTDLRTNLDSALSALNLPPINYQHLTITPQVSVVYKVDLQELRDAVK
jgi:Fibronectin type III domain